MAEKNHMTPVIPGLWDELQVIQYYVGHACDVPWIVYVEALKPWAHDLAVMLLGLDLGDLVKGFFRPKGLRSGMHHRKGSKGGRKGGGIPDITEMVGDKIHIDEIADHRAFRGTRAALIIGSELVDRVAFEGFLAGKVEEGLIAPIMGALRFDKRKCPDYSFLCRDMAPGGWGLPNPDWVAYGFGDYVSSNRVYSPNAYYAMPLEGECLAVWGGHMINDHPYPENIGVRMLGGGGGPVLAQQGPTLVEGGESFEFCMSARVKAGESVTGQVLEDGGGFYLTGGYFAMFQIGD